MYIIACVYIAVIALVEFACDIGAAYYRAEEYLRTAKEWWNDGNPLLGLCAIPLFLLGAGLWLSLKALKYGAVILLVYFVVMMLCG